MVVFLTTPLGSGHIDGFVRRYGRHFGRLVVEMTYAEFLRLDRIPVAVYVFGDLQRMAPEARQLAVGLAEALRKAIPGVRILNDPVRQLGRYEMLRKLHEMGRNEFDVYRLPELVEARAFVRYPVFVRLENDHGGPRSGLVRDEAELLGHCAKLVLEGAEPSNVLIVEFLETANEAGVYRKYGAFRIGGRIIGQNVFQSYDWNTKAGNRFRDPAAQKESDDYFVANPHADMLMPVFELAGIEYGRVDFGFKDGRLQVWEINDNPMFVSRKPARLTVVEKAPTYEAAFRELCDGLEVGETAEMDRRLVYAQLGPGPVTK
jgi:hypothetical protein